jgi:uncharacterized membrane protein
LASLSEAKTLGGIGSILVLLTIVPNVGWVLGIVGFVMTLFAIKYISDAVADRTIFSDMLISIIFTVAATIVGGVVIIGTFLRVLGMGTFVSSTFVISPSVTVGDWIGLAAAVLAGLVVVWGLLVVSSVFLRRSYNLIASKLRIDQFRTGATLYLIGAATAIIGIGFILIFVAEILFAVGFFSIKENVPEIVQAPPAPMQQ